MKPLVNAAVNAANTAADSTAGIDCRTEARINAHLPEKFTGFSQDNIAGHADGVDHLPCPAKPLSRNLVYLGNRHLDAVLPAKNHTRCG